MKLEKIPLPGGYCLDFSGPALVMAIVNCNNDSFYKSSQAYAQKAVDMALEAEQAGASIIDFGAESSRPGSDYIDESEELIRIIPVIKSFRKYSKLPVSIDTRKAAVARAALDEGADIINDISALDDDKKMAPLCAQCDCPVILMHMKGKPKIMQIDPVYKDVVSEVSGFLLSAAEGAEKAGIKKSNIILDPGIGFGKSTEDNLKLMAHLAEIKLKGYPLLIGLSRKSFIGDITGRSVEERLAGTLAAAAAAVMAGADIIRLHDVKEGLDMVKVLDAIKKAGYQGKENGMVTED